MARQLTWNERDLVEWLLRESRIPAVDALRAQIPFAQVVEGTPSMPTYLHLAVSGASPATCKDGVLPGGAVVESPGARPPASSTCGWKVDTSNRSSTLG